MNKGPNGVMQEVGRPPMPYQTTLRKVVVSSSSPVAEIEGDVIRFVCGAWVNVVTGDMQITPAGLAIEIDWRPSLEPNKTYLGTMTSYSNIEPYDLEEGNTFCTDSPPELREDAA